LRIGVVFFPSVGPADKPAHQYFDECLRLVDLAEELGYDHVKIVEHYFFTYGGYSPDATTFLAAAAGRTRRIRLGTSATIPAFQHPVKLAGKLAMLDNLSGGRLDAAFGRAFLPDEFEAFGIPLDESRRRFTENVAAVQKLWSEENVVWNGEFHRFGPVTLLPRPVQQPHPPVFVTTAQSVESVAEAARQGHHLQTVPNAMSRTGLEERLRLFRAEWAGTDAPQIHLTFPALVSEDAEGARKAGRLDDELHTASFRSAVESWRDVSSTAYPGYEKLVDKLSQASDFDAKVADNKLLVGTPDAVRGQLETIAEWYGDDITLSLGIHSGHLSYEDAATSLRLLADTVLPSLARP
jgi:alkanesulfonate monooxygenase SsuD/methylene tetrahydromethanopterin reductase-like flavin-dependent oxidoreductase (luciferase family)